MVIVRAPELVSSARLDSYNRALLEAGVLLAAERLASPVDNESSSTDPVAAFWLWQVKSLDEAIEWVKRCPVAEADIEIRQVVERGM